MKTKPASQSKVRLVVTDKSGHRAASVPAVELAPLRFRMKKILVPLDFSEPSHQALRYAKSFAEQFGASLTLVHVVEPMLYPAEFGYVPVGPGDLDQKRLDDLHKRIQKVAADLRATVPVDGFVRLGRSWKEIVDTAKAGDSDLIIISTHGYTGLKHALLGSVAEKIVRHAPCPVLVVRTEEHDFV